MELYFLRHAIAAQRGDGKYKDDSLRPLTDEGLEKMHRAGLGMQALGLKFDAILSSPYLRARQTAEIVAQVYKIKNKKIYFTDNLLPPASIKDLLREIGDRALFSKIKNRALSPIKTVLLVGHEPHLSEMISSLLKSDKPLNIDFKKGGLCNLSISAGTATLNWLLTPTQLGLMAKEKQ